MPWQSPLNQNAQPHDQIPAAEENIKRNHYFAPSRFYCIEPICAPCGGTIAWAKMEAGRPGKIQPNL